MITREPRNHGLLAVADALVPLDVTGLGSVGIQLTGTWVGTVSFEASVDGRTFVALNAHPSNSTTPASSATGNGVWTSNCGGFAIVRARMSSYTSGTATVTIQGAQAGGGIR